MAKPTDKDGHVAQIKYGSKLVIFYYKPNCTKQQLLEAITQERPGEGITEIVFSEPYSKNDGLVLIGSVSLED